MGYFDFLNEEGDSPSEGARDRRGLATKPKPLDLGGGVMATQPPSGRNVEPETDTVMTAPPEPSTRGAGLTNPKPTETDAEKKAGIRSKKLKLQALDDQVTKAREEGLKVIRSLNMESGGLQFGLNEGFTPAGDVEKPSGVADIDSLFAQFKQEANSGTADVGRLADMMEQAADIYEKRGPEFGMVSDQAFGKAAAFRQKAKILQNALKARDEAEALRLEVNAGNIGQPQAAQPAAQPVPAQPSQTGQPPIQPNGQPAQAALPLGIDPFRALKNATGSEGATMDFLSKAMGMTRDYGDFDIDEADDFGTGMNKFLEGFGPDGKTKFYASMLKTFGGGMGQMAGQAVETSKTAPSPEQKNQAATDATQAAMRQKLAELRDTDPMRTTGGVLLFVVMSMLLGPGSATLLLNNRAKQGKLQDDVTMLKMKLRQLDQERASQARRQEQMLGFRQQAAMEDHRQKNRMTLEQQKAGQRQLELVQKAAMMRQSGKKNPIFDKMMSLYNGALNKSRALSSAMDFDGAKKALEGADWYYQQATEAAAGELEGE